MMADAPFSPRHGALGAAQSGEADPELMGLLMDEPMDISQSQIIERQAETIAKLEEDVVKGKEYKTLTKVKLKEAAARLKEYRLKVEGLMVEVESAKAEVKKLEADKKRTTTLARKKVGEAMDTAALERANAAAKSAEERAQRAERRAKDAEAAAASAKVQIEALRKQLAQVETTKKDTMPPSTSDGQQAKEKEMQEVLAKAHCEIQALKTQALQLEKEKQAAEKKAAMQMDKRLTAEATMSKSKAEADALKGQLKALEREKKEAENKLVTQATQKAQVDSNIKELKADVETLKKKLHDSHGTIRVAKDKLAAMSKQLAAAQEAALKANARAEAMAKKSQELEKETSHEKSVLCQPSFESRDLGALSTLAVPVQSPTNATTPVQSSITSSVNTLIDDPLNHQQSPLPIQEDVANNTVKKRDGQGGRTETNTFDAISAAIDAELEFSDDEANKDEPMRDRMSPSAHDRPLPVLPVKILSSMLDDDISREIDKELEFSSSNSSDTSSDNEFSEDEDVAAVMSRTLTTSTSLVDQSKELLVSDAVSAAIDAELASSSEDEEPSATEPTTESQKNPSSPLATTLIGPGKEVDDAPAALLAGSLTAHHGATRVHSSTNAELAEVEPEKEFGGRSTVTRSGITPRLNQPVRETFDHISAALAADLESSEDETMDECTLKQSTSLSTVEVSTPLKFDVRDVENGTDTAKTQITENDDLSSRAMGSTRNDFNSTGVSDTAIAEDTKTPRSHVKRRTLSVSSDSSASSGDSNTEVERTLNAPDALSQNGMHPRKVGPLAVESPDQHVPEIDSGNHKFSIAVIGVLRPSGGQQALQSGDEDHNMESNVAKNQDKGQNEHVESNNNVSGEKRRAEGDALEAVAAGIANVTTKKRRVDSIDQIVLGSQERAEETPRIHVKDVQKVTKDKKEVSKSDEVKKAHDSKQSMKATEPVVCPKPTNNPPSVRSDSSSSLAPRVVAAFKIACGLQEGEKPDGTYVLRTLGVLIKNLAPLVKMSGNSSVDYRTKFMGDVSIVKLITILCEEYRKKAVDHVAVLDGIVRVYRTPRTRHIMAKSIFVLAAVFEVVLLKTLEMDEVDSHHDGPPEINECLRKLRDLVVPSRYDISFVVSFNGDLDRKREMVVANAISANSRKPTNISHDKIFLAHVCAFYASICRALRLEQLSRVLLIDLLKSHPDIKGLYCIQAVVQVHPAVLRKEWDSQGNERSSWVRETIIQLLLNVTSLSRDKLETVNEETAVTMLSSVAAAIDEPQLLQSSLGFDSHPDEVLGMFMDSFWRKCVEACMRKPSQARISDSAMALELLGSVCGEPFMMRYFSVAKLASLCNDCGEDGGKITAVVRMMGAIARGILHHSSQTRRNTQMDSDVSMVDQVLDRIQELWHSNEPWRTNPKFVDASVREFSDILQFLSTRQEKLHQRDMMLKQLLRIFDWQGMRLLSPSTLRKLRALVTVARGFVA